jgi:hypothetical protein
MLQHKPKLLIIGHGRHGKDTVCDILRDQFDFSFQSSSEFCARKFIYDDLRAQYHYSSYQECYADRHNRREQWYDLIHAYCSTDHAKLGREIFAEHDIYCGLRNKAEFHAMRNQAVFDYAIWVDRSDHLPVEEKSSMTLEIWMADYVLDNNSTLLALKKNTSDLMRTILLTHQAQWS